MSNLLILIGAALLTLPLLAWYLVYIMVAKVTKNKGKAIRTAADTTTILFITAVHLLVMEIWGESYFWLLLLIILTTAVFFTIIHYRSGQDVEFMRLIKGIWRFTFFLFLAGYIILAGYGWGLSLLSAFIG
ncbi:DUF3397 domain-containing protein [Salibacterium aidingense]|uniref:DUF3397 domain-containing protein n=1 Tax=Salibacterium aidingense TaxID=384933 RepID=UPI000426079D|nr:DUF3397 domain-containing protein [Salibacterium aidingense]